MPDAPINQILASLNNARIQQKQPALYQAIKGLIESARSNQTGIVASADGINSQLNGSLTWGTSSVRANYNPVATAGNLIIFYETDTGNLWVFANAGWHNITTGGTGVLLHYLTWSDDSAILTNSRQLLAGTNVAFDDTVPNARTVNVASSSTPPGGSNKQVQFNNAGAFGGISNGTAGQVLTSNGAAVTPSFQALPTQLIQFGSVRLTNAQIKALPTTGIDIVSAPGAGFYHRLIYVTHTSDFSAGAYTNINATYADFRIGYTNSGPYAGGYIADDAVSTPVLAQITNFFGAASGNVVLGNPYNEQYGSAGNPGYVLAPVNTRSAYENQPLTACFENSGSGDLTGGNAANNLLIQFAYVTLPII